MVTDRLDRDVVLVSDKLVVQALFVGFERVTHDLQKCGFYSLRVLLDLIFDDRLNYELKNFANRHHSQ